MTIMTADEHRTLGYMLWEVREQAVTRIAHYLSAFAHRPHLEEIRKNHDELIQAIDALRVFLEDVANHDLTPEQAQAFYRPDSQGKKPSALLANYSNAASERFEKNIGAMEEDLENLGFFYGLGVSTSCLRARYPCSNAIPITNLIASQKERMEADRLTNNFASCLIELFDCFEQMEKEAAHDEQ